MAWTLYAYALGHDAALVDFILYETTFTLPALTAPDRITRGTETSSAADGSQITDGWQMLTLVQVGDPYGVTKFADLDTYVEAVWADGWDGDENAEISIKARQQNGDYIYVNCLAFLPVLGQDYRHETSTRIRDLTLRNTVLNAYTPA